MNGNFIRQIRENKGFSLSQLSVDIMSDAQLSKFERNETSITYDKFLLLLDRLEVTMEEYLYLSKNSSLYSTETLIENIKEVYINKDISKLMQFRDYELQKGEKLNAIMITALAKNIDANIELELSELTEVCDYLFTVDTWGKHEIILFGNIVICLPVEIILSYVQQLVQQRKKIYEIKTNNKLFIGTIINISFLLLNYEMFDEVSSLFDLIKREIGNNEYLLLERNSFLFVKGLYLYKIGDRETGINNMQKAITVYKYLDCKNLSDDYEEYFSKLVQ